MLSGVGFSELVLLFVIGLLILGPERLPRVASQLGRWVGKARRTANQLRFQMEREIALADIERTQTKKRKEDEKTAPRSDGTAQEHKESTDARSAAVEPGDAADANAPDSGPSGNAEGADASGESTHDRN